MSFLTRGLGVPPPLVGCGDFAACPSFRLDGERQEASLLFAVLAWDEAVGTVSPRCLDPKRTTQSTKWRHTPTRVGAHNLGERS